MTNISDNQKYVDLFNTFAKLFSFRGEKNDFFRIRSSQNTAQTLESLEYNIEENIDTSKNKFKNKIKGIGAASEDKIIELYTTKQCQELNELFEIYPKSLLELLNIKGLGPKKVMALYENFQVKDQADLEKILEQPEKLEKISIKAKTVTNIKEALANNYQGKSRTNISDIYDQISSLILKVKNIPNVLDAHAAGSFRRLENTIGDIDIIITCQPEHTEQIIEKYTQLSDFQKIINQGSTKVTAISNQNMGVDLRIIHPNQLGACLQYFTGNRNHNIQIRQLAKDLGYKINEYGLFKISDESLVESESEEKIYNLLGLQYIPPTMRSGTTEIIKAQSNTLNYITQEDCINQIEFKGDQVLINNNQINLPSNIFRIENNQTQKIEDTLQKMYVLGKNKKRLFMFETENTELAIKLIQKTHIDAAQIINCFNKEQLSKVVI